jgi:hypothetical protein
MGVRFMSSKTSFLAGLFILLTTGVVWLVSPGPVSGDTKSKPQQIEPLIVSQRVELIYGHECIEAVVPHMDLEVHVPLDEEGKSIPSQAFAKGGANYKIKAGCQPRINIVREEKAQ